MSIKKHKMRYNYKQPPRHLSSVLSRVLERQLVLDKSITSSKMAVYQDGDRKFEMKLRQCAINAAHDDRLPIITEYTNKAVSFDGLPVDLSKRSNEITLTNNDEPSIIKTDEKPGEINDEPLSLSKCNFPQTINNKASSPDRLQKRGRLEEVVRYIRQCSEDEGPKFCLKSTNGCHRSCDASDPDSESDIECKPMKRSLSCSAMTSSTTVNGKSNLERHRRKRTAPYPNRTSDILHVDCRNDDVFNRRLYPTEVINQPLLLSINGKDEHTELIESDIDSVVDDNIEEISPLHRRSPVVRNGSSTEAMYKYYADLFQNLQNSFPAAAQRPLMAANIDSSIAQLNDSIIIQSPLKMDEDTKSNEADGSPNVLLRKRARRALTGKHVKQGTGASPTTLITLRQKIEQKMNQHSKVNHLENGALHNGKRSVKNKSNKKKVNSS